MYRIVVVILTLCVRMKIQESDSSDKLSQTVCYCVLKTRKVSDSSFLHRPQQKTMQIFAPIDPYFYFINYILQEHLAQSLRAA
jgi:hypothetical protein